MNIAPSRGNATKEKVLKAAIEAFGIGRNIEIKIPNVGALAVGHFLIVKLTAAILEFANHRLCELSVTAVCPIEVPLAAGLYRRKVNRSK